MIIVFGQSHHVQMNHLIFFPRKQISQWVECLIDNLNALIDWENS